MFHAIPAGMQARMLYLEEVDERDRVDGTPQARRLRQVPRETGRLLAILAALAPKGKVLEIGTSAGYSTMWLSLGSKVNGASITTFEILPAKASLARETFRQCGIDGRVRLVEGDALSSLEESQDIALCFLDAEKDIYADCYERIVPKLVRGGLLVADNAISHRDALQSMLDRALSDARIDAVVVPIGHGLLICRKL